MRPRSVSSVHAPAALTAVIRPRRVVEFLIYRSRCTRSLGIAVALACSIPAPASTIFLTGGALNGQPLSPTEWTISVAPGEPITGNVLAQVHTTGSGPGVVFPLGYTWTWGLRQTAMVLLSSDAPFGTSNWNVPINLSAPTTPGTYYILFGVRGEFTLTQVFSATNWTAGSGVWGDGNDYHDMDDADLLTAHENGGFPDWPVLFPAGFQPSDTAVMPVQVNVEQPGPAVIFVDDDNCPGPGSGTLADPYCSIQTAIDAAVGGDEIVVVPVTYFETINFLAKAITLRSSAGPAVTTINALSTGSVVTCNSGEGFDTVLDGFTITGGLANFGAGMFNNGSSPTVAHCTFTGNIANTSGGGMINLNSSSPTVTNCTFSGNIAIRGGGMLNFTGSRPIVTDCSFSGNSADFGGGMVNNGSSPTVTDCSFIDNIVDFSGGGMQNFNSSPKVTNCTFSGNIAMTRGGGMSNFDGSRPMVTDCTFSGNTANFFGGGISVDDSSPKVTNCTFSGNMAAMDGGGMQNVGTSSPMVTNCILWGDTPNEIGGAGVPTVSFSDVQGGFPGIGNIDADPMFIDADGPDDIPGTEDDDLRLSPGSPCIDAADNTAVPLGVTTDLDGNPRFVDDPGVADTGIGPPPVVDMGAYEFQGISFQAQVFPADGEPIIEAVGDLDGDGDTDVVVAIPDQDPLSDGRVQVFVNQGRDPVTGEWLGLQAILPTIPVGRDPSGVAVGLFNNDSLLDIAVTNSGDNDVAVLINNGGSPPTFTRLTPDIPVGNDPSAIAAGDFNGDTLIDLVVTNGGDNNVITLINDGNAMFIQGGTFAVGLNPRAIDPWDGDGDKCLDAVAANRGSANVSGLLNGGGGNFDPAINLDVGLDPLDLVTGDLDLNGFADIVTADNGDGTVSVILNNGSGTFDPAFPILVGASPRSVEAVDLDGDFDLDLVVVAVDPVIGPAIQVLENLINGGGGAPLGGNELAFGPPIAFSVGADPNFVVSADFNGDGVFDLVTVNADADQVTGGSVTVLLASPPAFAGLLVSLDIKPGGCPNSLNRKSHGVLPVALVGTSGFDAAMIDVASVLISRVDGIGGSVAPNEGPPGPHSVLEDVATPFDGELCGCHDLEGDGILDLSMKFRTQRIVEELQFSDLPGGAFVGLVVSGTLVDGTPFMASDCIRIVPAPDIDGDGAVGVADLLLLLGALGSCTPAQECLADLDEDGTVSISDLLVLLANWS